MSLYDAKYPNLELIEFQFNMILQNDAEWLAKVKAMAEKNKFVHPNFDMIVFPQIWGSTCTAFDECKDGSPAVGGYAMTKAYTVVVTENLTKTYGIFVDGRPCYKVTDPPDVFFEDLAERRMASLSQAKVRYNTDTQKEDSGYDPFIKN